MKAIYINACYECPFCRMKEEGFYCSLRAFSESNWKFIADFKTYMEKPFIPDFCPLPDIQDEVIE